MRKIRTVRDEERIYDSQEEEIAEKYGTEEAGNANYGWFADDYVISTKVYGTGMVLSSYYVGDKIIHRWEELWMR